MDELALGEVISCRDTDPCDITLVVKDGKQFLAHGKVLSKASPFFERLLGSNMKESNEGVIRLHTITESQMADILRFIYSGSIQISSQEYAVNLLETADFLLLSNLKTIAERFLEQGITTETCFSINHLAEQYSREALIASTQKIINSNFTTVTASNEFLNLPSHEVEKWISSDEIVIDAEENVFEIILRWIDQDKSERSGKFSELFSHVRLTYLSRDYLLSHVVTNNLVKENVDCLDNVRDALEWLDRPTDCEYPRSHHPRKALTINVIVIADYFGELQPCFYVPAKDEWYLLPANESQRLNTTKHNVSATVSCRGKVFSITDDIARSQCYDPDSNRWSPAPWADNLPFSTGKPLVVKNQICFIVEETESTTLWTYSLESNSWTPSFNWVEIISFCVVAVDSYIYVIGGAERNSSDMSLSQCGRFDTEKNEWQKIAPLNEARCDAFGVCKNEKIFIAGGSTSDGLEIVYLETCEVYNILRDEWQFMANLTIRRTWGSMLLVDETLYVLGGRTKMRYQSPGKFSNKVECYNHESDDAWCVKATVPIRKITMKKRKKQDFICYFLKGCSLRVFKGVLTNLKSVAA